MKLSLPLFLLLLSLSSLSQTIHISGRCYYDANGNNVFDGTDSVLVNGLVFTSTPPYQSHTDASGQYSLDVSVGSYNIEISQGTFAADDYKCPTKQRNYLIGGTDIIDFALQKRDSITAIRTYLAPVNFSYNDIPSTGGAGVYNLNYGYDGLLQSMPVTITLNFNPMLSLASASPAPTATGLGKLQWNFPAVQRTPFFNTIHSIALTFNYPAVGDTIGAFLFASKLIPGIAVTKPPQTDNWDEPEFIDFPMPQSAGATKGVKWLRHFAGAPSASSESDECISIDTIQNGSGYFIGGNRSSLSNRPFIARLSNDGLSIWEKYLDSLPGGHSFNVLTAIKHTPDGGCTVLGTVPIAATIGSNNKVSIARFDSSGAFVWGKILNGSGAEEVGDLSVLADGSCLVTGNSSSNDGDFLHQNADTTHSNIFLTKLSANGNIIFTKIYGGNNEDYGYRIKPLQNGSVLILGATDSDNGGDVVGAHMHQVYPVDLYSDTLFPSEAWILKVDGSTGNIIWSRCYGGTGYSYLIGAAENNGGILLTGVTNSKDGDLPYYPEPAVALWVLQISNTGSIVSSRLHKMYKGYQDSNYIASLMEGYYENNLLSSLHKTKDGNFILGGTITDKYGPIKARHGESDFMIVKINPAGDILRQKAIGGNDFDDLRDLQLDKNDDIIFVGQSSSENDDLYQHHDRFSELMVVAKLGITNVIKGQVYIDNNGNHIKDAAEPYFSQGRINSTKATDTIATRIFDGRFLNNVDTGNYTSYYQPANNYYTVFPINHTTSFTNLDLTDSIDFALIPKPNVNDLEVQLLPISRTRLGSDVTYRVITKNVGTTTLNNVVIGIKKDSRETYTDASRNETGVLADSIWWGPFKMDAFDIDTLFVTFTLNTPAVLNIGDTILLQVTANPIINDSSVANNVAKIKEIVRGSFDPNDKSEIHAGTLTTTQYAGGEWLQYLIRFQNTGSDTAFYITIKDTLQSRLDLNSLEIISASHPYTFNLNGNVATWDFKKILLPDSTTDEAASHGFIHFKIKPRTGLSVGDEFTNKAAIYFDYNLPVITNLNKTIIGNNLGVCPGGNASFTAGVAGNSYQWQVNSGTGFTNLTNTGIYSGVTTGTLSLTAALPTMYGYKYRCVVNGTTNSPENTLKFSVRWLGTAGVAWENTANWDCGVLPNDQTDVVIPAGVVYPLVSSVASCYSLRLSPGSTVTVKSGSRLIITGKPN